MQRPVYDIRIGAGHLAHRLVGVVVLLATLPLFIDLGDRTLTLGRLVSGLGSEGQEAGTRMHLAVVLIAVLWFLTFLRRPRPQGPLAWVVVALAGWFTVAAAWGLIRGGTATGMVFYVQAMVPLLAWFAGRQSPARAHTVARAVMVGTSITASLALFFTLANGGLSDVYQSSIALEGAIPQYRSYFPAIVALGAAFATAYLRTDRLLSLTTLAFVGALVPITWSRGGLLMIGIAVSVTGAVMLVRRLTRRQLLAVGLCGALLAGTIAALVLSAGLLAQRAELSDLDASDNARIVLAQEALERIIESPVVGDAFQPYSDDLSGGRTATFDRLFPTHNQYLDHGIRAGLPAVFLLLVFLVLTVSQAWRTLHRRPYPDVDPFITAGLGFVCALLPAALTELYLTQTWTGIVIMLTLGTLSALSDDQAARATSAPPVSSVFPPNRGVGTPSN